MSEADGHTTGDALPEWHVDVDGCVNFRDAGGWRTVNGGLMRRGVLYRSDDPIRITADGRRAVDALALAMVVDLRQQTQFSRTPGFVEPARTVHVPLVDQVVDHRAPPPLDTARDIADLYWGMLEESHGQIGRVLDVVAANVSNGPVLVHCAFGKDRAGLITAIIHAAIGVRREDIVADYVRSDAPAHRRREVMMVEPLEDDPPVARLPEPLFRASAETMERVLDRVIEQHGSLAAWVASFPTAPSTVARLREQLVDSTSTN
jgi:protein-tyrosine phosphatase